MLGFQPFMMLMVIGVMTPRVFGMWSPNHAKLSVRDFMKLICIEF
jgi:hypothetical protein